MKIRRNTRNNRKRIWAVIALLGICSSAAVFARNVQQTLVTAGDIQTVDWPSGSITWSLNPTNTIVYASNGVLATEAQLKTVLNTAFGLWSGALYQGNQVNTLNFSEGSDNTNASFVNGDCINTIGFTDNLGSTGTIALTQVTSYTSTTTPFTYPCTTGTTPRTCPNQACITDADIEFNTSYDFTTPSYSQSGYYDLQTVATHEIGHLMGLDHSGLANAIMYPYGDSGNGGVKSALAVDDEIATATLYPNNAITPYFSSVKGTVTVGGSNAFAAHVLAIDASTGNIVTDTLSNSSGAYDLQLFSGNYYIQVLPLATDTSGDSGTNGVTSINNYHGFACVYATTPSSCTGLPSNPTNFTGTYY